MKSLEHPNIVKLFDVFPLSDSHMVMVFEYCSGGDLSKYIIKNQRLSESRAQRLMIQLAKALRFLRTMNIIHRDLKPQNLLLSSGGEDPHIKIADFGFARFIEPQSVADTLCGSPLYMAPEILHMQKYTIKADLWSVGMILYEMLVGMPPFLVKSHIELMRVIDTQSISLPSVIKNNISSDCHDLIISLLQKDPAKRIGWEEFFMDPWIGLLNRDNNISILHTTSTPIAIGSPPKLNDHNSLGKGEVLPFDESSSTNFSLKNPSNQRGTLLADERPFEITDSDHFVSLLSDSNNRSEEISLQSLEDQSRRAFAILSLADIKAESNQNVDAFVLYMKGLSLIRSILIKATQMQQSASIQFQTSSHQTFQSLFNHYREAFREYLRKTDYLRQSLQATDSTISPEKLIYDFAIHLGNEGALSEGLLKFDKARKLYENGLLLIEQLESEAVLEDKFILRNFISAFLQRLEMCQESDL
eukprot:TRINITY_DN1208_c0_g1_i2.p1 TRINITY_DN1208_c0_g1~~TRINITY_DN1208_c0_g1_i2.p1  ORF type:complete len:473 (+),score=64.27 TRINITY_DN1208_c0_g1_i2:558-1976(+)